MPEYLAPGVYVEEVSFRAKSIEGVSTTTTGFIGPSRTGPVDLEPELLTSLADFEATYGDGQQLLFDGLGVPIHNFSWHAVRAFFEEGGKRLYFVRAFRHGKVGDGRAGHDIPTGRTGEAIRVRSRFPGAAGNVRIRLTLQVGPNLLSGRPGSPRVSAALQHRDVVRIDDLTSPLASPLEADRFYLAEETTDPNTHQPTFTFTSRGGRVLQLSDLAPDADPGLSDRVRVVTLMVTVESTDPNRPPGTWAGLPLDPQHRSFGAPDSFARFFGTPPSNTALAATLPITIELADDGKGGRDGPVLRTGLDVLAVLDAASLDANLGSLRAALLDDGAADAARTLPVLLENGNDGARPSAEEYKGESSNDSTARTGLTAFEAIEDISIVAAPGSTYRYEHEYRDDAATILGHLISHAERMRYRIAVLDSGDGQTLAQVRALRGRLDSSHAALYYPWVTILDPITRREIDVPPSGSIAGIYARNDTNRAVYKAPANEVVNLALDFEHRINQAQQEVLNPEGVNCLRFFEGRGFRVWGARTVSSDPEWKYVNLRRYFAYLERSIDRGTQWAVFEPNAEALWTNVRLTISDFLFNEWASGALLGSKPEQAYFVRCDRSTMTQNDLDNGRLICLIGVAAIRPAEFVIFRIGQWTASRPS